MSSMASDQIPGLINRVKSRISHNERIAKEALAAVDVDKEWLKDLEQRKEEEAHRG